MFTVSEENTVKCLAGSSDIFGNGRTSSLVFGNIRQSSGIFGSLCRSEINCCKITENSLILNRIKLAFFFLCLFLEKIYCFKECFTASVKCLKFNSFMLQSQKNEVLVLLRHPPLDLLKNTTWQKQIKSRLNNYVKINPVQAKEDF